MSNHTLEEVIMGARSVQSPYYFNGRLLSAEDLSEEHAATRAREQSLARAIGAGVVSGLQVTRTGATPAGAVIVSVSRGLALNRCGQNVELCEDLTLSLERPTTLVPGSSAKKVFGPCGPAGSGAAPPLNGAYVLTIEPVAQKNGRAPISGIGNTVATCNTRSLVDGVQFRLVQLSGHGVVSGPRSRNQLAWYCLGALVAGSSPFAPVPSSTSLAPLPALEDPAKATRLAESEVPLALVSWSSSGVFEYLDLWAVRRHPTAPDAASGLGYLMGLLRLAEIESSVLQFDAHLQAILAESGSHTGLVANTRFQYLPPVGFLPSGNNQPPWNTFFGPHATGVLIPLNSGSVRAVLQSGLRREPWRVLSATEAIATPDLLTPINVYQVSGLTNYLLFARSARGETTAAEVHFDNRHCQLPGVETVQDALDSLCGLQRSCCTHVVTPGAGWEAVFGRIAPGQDAEICLQAGTYPLTQGVTIQGKGHLRLLGAGSGTRIVASGSENALLFRNCASVRIETLHAEANVAAANTSATVHLNGVLTLDDCPQVDLSGLSVECAPGPSRAAAGITVRNTQFTGTAASRTSARIRQCLLVIGHEQTGILLVNVARGQVEDNVVRVGAGITTPVALTDSELRGRLRRHLFDSMVAGVLPAGIRQETNATVNFNQHSVHFLTAPELTSTADRNNNAWQIVLNSLNPSGMSSATILLRHLLRLGDLLIQTGGVGGTIPTVTATSLTTLRSTLVNSILPALSQGIAVGGRLAGEVRIVNNSIIGAQQGIHVGLSHHESSRGATDNAGMVSVQGNSIQISLPNTATRERHGIFIGNCRNFLIENNQLSAQRGTRMTTYRLEGVRIFGQLDRRAIIRANHFAGFTVGIRFEPRNQFSGGRQWIAADNMALGASPVVQFPTGLSGLRIENNFA